MKNIIYSRGFPYGAPMIWIRGGGTKDDAVKAELKRLRFWWSPDKHAWEGVVVDSEEMAEMLLNLRAMGYNVSKKDTDNHQALIGE